MSSLYVCVLYGDEQNVAACTCTTGVGHEVFCNDYGVGALMPQGSADIKPRRAA